MPIEAGDPMAAEFDTVAEWTAQVAAHLGPEYAIPAGCRGSGQPAVLDWLLAGLAPAPGEPIVDVGAGVGGPAAYAAATAGVRPLLLDPEHGACRAAARLFGAPVIQADATALPLPGACTRLAWSLGVLCTLPGRDAQLAMLRELRRIVGPDGRIGLLVYVALSRKLDNPPAGDHFPASGDLDPLAREAGLEVLQEADAHRMDPPPADWRGRAEAVERELHRRFGRTPQLRTADKQSGRIGGLLKSGQLTSRVLVLRAAESPAQASARPA